MKVYFTILALSISLLAVSQRMGPQSGSQPKSFGALPDNLSFLDNSINQFTGQVQFSLPLMGLSGRGNLSYTVAASYNSQNAKEIVNVWNREAPTGILGLGWSVGSPKIISDHKGTGTRTDDDFYIVEGGSSNKLILDNIQGSVWEFKGESYVMWKIFYNTANEKWTITRDDGTQYIYGDQSSGRGTVQYMVRRGNWIGNSSATGQEQHAYIWDLSEIIDIWGDKLIFEYLQHEEEVRASTGRKKHTRASYIKEIKNLNNEKLVFNYGSKTYNVSGIREYVDIHQEASEPDAYQEKYESLYLDKITLYNENSEVLTETRFGYSSLGSNEFYKRLLTSIKAFNPSGNSLPGFQFQYETGTGSTNNTGAMTQVTSPLKGIVSFVYDKQTLSATNRELLIDPVAGYAEPRIFIGEDYVVVTRRQYDGVTHVTTSKTARVDLFTWEGGRWIPSLNVATLTGVTLKPNGDGTHNQDFQVVLGKDFFAILNPTLGVGTKSLHLFGRDKYRRATWFQRTESFIAANNATLRGNMNDPVLLAGDDFVMLGSSFSVSGSAIQSVKHFVYQIDGSSWNEVLTEKATGFYNYAVASNYIITHNNEPNPDVFTRYFHYQNNSWSGATLTLPSAVETPANSKSNWQATSSFALLMAAGNPTEYIFWWDENYGSTISKYNISVSPAIPDYAHVNFVNNSMATIVDTFGGYAFRFDGNTWNPSGLLDYYGPNIYFRNLFSFGDDFVWRPRGATSVQSLRMSFYNPNNQTSPYWYTGPDITATSENLYASLAGNNYVTYAGKFFFRSIGGSWPQDATTISYNWIKSGGGWNDTYLQGGYDFVATGDPYAYGSIGINIKNGAVVPTTVTFPITAQGAQRVWDRASTIVSSPQAAMNTLVTYFGNATFDYMENATTLKLYRKVNDEFYGSISSFVAIRVENNDGATTRYTNYVYDWTTASVDPTGFTPQFNKVTRITDDDSNPVTRPVGYTEAFYFNGLPSNMVSSGGEYPAIGGNSTTTYKKLTGLNYKGNVYDINNALVSHNASDWELITVNNGDQPRPVFTTQTQDNQMIKSSLTYSSNGQLQTETEENISGGNFLTITNEYRYYWEIYDPTKSKNIIAPVVSQARKVNGAYTEASVTKWKNWNGTIPSPYQSFAWKHSGSTLFTGYWLETDPTPPAGNWKKLSTTNTVDVTRGLPKETVSVDGIIKTTIWHPTKPQVMAEVAYAGSNQILYEGFEQSTSNTSTTAKTGLKSYSVSYTVVIPSPGTYLLTYWRKIGAADWERIEQTITGNIAIGGGGTLVDEVRVAPVGAIMTTYAYDRFGNVIAVCDANDLITYHEYDEFNRPKISRDKDRNIIEYSQYNIKN